VAKVVGPICGIKTMVRGSSRHWQMELGQCHLLWKRERGGHWRKRQGIVKKNRKLLQFHVKNLKKLFLFFLFPGWQRGKRQIHGQIDEKLEDIGDF